jgi:benzoyl-CoA 2,3-dioxygenase component B
VNVEEGRHLWAMVYLLHTYFGRDGREEAEGLLERRSGNPDKPRILGAFNEPCRHWLSFFMFTYFTDRDGKYQLLALAESGFDPLARTTRFMLTEEAHHMFVGETGVRRTPRPSTPPASRAATRRPSRATTTCSTTPAYGVLEVDGKLVTIQAPYLNAINEKLRDDYVTDAKGGIERWNKIIQKAGIPFTLAAPHKAFNRKIGPLSAAKISPQGQVLSEAEWTHHHLHGCPRSRTAPSSPR